MRTRLSLVASAAALLAGAGAAEAAGPPRLTVTSLGETERAEQGSFCWQTKKRTATGRPSFVCGDYFYPLDVDCGLPVAPGAAIKVRTGTAVRRIHLALVSGTPTDGGPDHLEWTESRRSGKGRKVWRFELPAEIGQAAAIDISIVGRRGDSNTWTGLATPACAALPPRVERAE